MKKTNILFLGLILSLLVFSKNAIAYSIFEDEPMIDAANEQQYEFPLDNQPVNIFNKNEINNILSVESQQIVFVEFFQRKKTKNLSYFFIFQ